MVELPARVAAFAATTTLLSPGEVAAFLGTYLVQHQQYEEAAAQLDLALKADPASPRAIVAMAQLEMGRQQYGSAENSLIALGKSDDWLVAYSAAMAMADLAGVGIALIGIESPEYRAFANEAHGVTIKTAMRSSRK